MIFEWIFYIVNDCLIKKTMYVEIKLQELQYKLEEYERQIKELTARNLLLESKLKRTAKKSECLTNNTSLGDLDLWISTRHLRRSCLKSNNIYINP